MEGEEDFVPPLPTESTVNEGLPPLPAEEPPAIIDTSSHFNPPLPSGTPPNEDGDCSMTSDTTQGQGTKRPIITEDVQLTKRSKILKSPTLVGSQMPKRKLENRDLPGNVGITGIGQSIDPSGGDPFELRPQNDEWEILDDLEVNEEDNKAEMSDSDGSDNDEILDTSLNDSDIERLLEQALPPTTPKSKDKKKSESKDEIKADAEENIKTKDDGKEKSKPKSLEGDGYRLKLKLREKGLKDLFGYLPEGWIKLDHFSGIPIFLHKKTRVVTFSQPYYIGKASARKHNIPIRAIPCFQYKKALEEEKEIEDKKAGKDQPKCPFAEATDESKEDTSKNKSDNIDDAISKQWKEFESQIKIRQERLEEKMSEEKDKSVKDGQDLSSNKEQKSDQPNNSNNNPNKVTEESANKVSQTENPTSNKYPTGVAPLIELEAIPAVDPDITPPELYRYATKLFEFDVLRTKICSSWKEQRKLRKEEMLAKKPALPYDAKVIRCKTITPEGSDVKPNKRDFILTVHNKSIVCILHEYSQHALRKQPTFDCQDSGIAATPYCVSVKIGDMSYGTGLGSSKKTAKMEAAKASMKILSPEIYKAVVESSNKVLDKFSFFDELVIEDSRIDELSQRVGIPRPYDILLECMRRNFGMGNTGVTSACDMDNGKKRNVYVMTVGKQEVKLVCKNKRQGKQLASQAMLQKLHPYVKSWGSLLRLYSNDTPRPKVLQEEESIDPLIETEADIEGKKNYSILDKLKEEMLKLQNKRDSIKSGIKGRIQMQVQVTDTPSVPIIDL